MVVKDGVSLYRSKNGIERYRERKIVKRRERWKEEGKENIILIIYSGRQKD